MIERVLSATGGLLQAAEPVRGDVRFLHDVFLPENALYRSASYQALLAEADAAVTSGSAAAVAARGRLRRVLGDGAGAAADLEQALRMDPECAAALAFRGESTTAEDPRAALEDLGRALRSEPGRPSYRLWRAYAHFLAADLERARADLDLAAASQGAPAAVYVLRALVFTRLGAPAQAVDDLTAAIGLAPRSPGLFTLRAAARAASGERDAAVEDAHRGLSLHPENIDGFIRLIQEREGLSRMEAGSEKAVLVEALGRLVREEPGCAWAYAVRAEAEKRAGYERIEACVADLETAVGLDASRAWMWAFWGRALTLRRDKKAWRGGLEKLDEAVRLEPGIGWIRSWRGEIYKELGRIDEAMADYDASIRIDPDYRLARTWRGAQRLARKEFAGAQEDFSAALEVRPSNAWTFHQRAAAFRGMGRYLPMLGDLRRSMELFSKYRLLHTSLDQTAWARFSRWRESLRDAWTRAAPGTRGGLLTASLRSLPAELSGVLLERGLFDKTPGRARYGAGSDAFNVTLAEALGAARSAPDDPLGPLWIGRVLLNKGSPRRARAALDRSLALGPCALAWAWRGEADLLLGDWAAARADLDRCLALDPGDGLAHAFRASVRARLGDFSGTWDDLLDAVRRDPAQAALYHDWAQLLFKTFGGAAWGGAVRAELALRAGDTAGCLEAAAASGGQNGTAGLLAGLALAQRGDGAGADAALAACAAMEPEGAARDLQRLGREIVSLGETAVASLRLAQGLALLRLQHWAEAVEAFDRALELRSGDARILTQRGEALLRLGDLPRAREDCERALAASEDAARRILLGRIALAAGESGAAEAELRRAAVLEPRSPDALFWLGQTLLERRDFAAAEEVFGRTLDIDKGRTLAWVGRGVARKELGRLEDSIADLEAARALAPELFASMPS